LTIDPLVALYFAVENVDERKDGVVMIYIREGYDFYDTKNDTDWWVFSLVHFVLFEIIKI